MYNLIMGAVDGILGVERMLEVVDPGLEDFVRPGGSLNEGRLMELPALVMPELKDSASRQVAQVGNIVSLIRDGSNYRFRFIRNSNIPEIPIRPGRSAGDRAGHRRTGIHALPVVGQAW